MQLKALACILGLVLIILLLIGRLIVFLIDRPEPEVHIPIITNLHNVWIMEVLDNGLLVFQDGEEKLYSYGVISEASETKEEEEIIYYEVSQGAREQIADITLTDGCVTNVTVKNEKISGKVLSANSQIIEIDGHGTLAISSNAKGYRLYDSLVMCDANDLLIGYDFNDFILENGEICAILMVKESAMEYIRILLQGADYNGKYHENVSFYGDTEYVIRYGTYDNMMEELHTASDVCTLDMESSYFVSDRVYIIPKVLTGKITLGSVNRSQGTPAYRGVIELLKTEDGIVVINEVLLEEYLFSVVPSEMPSSYPEEALKAQAICARTYAYKHMLKAGFPQYGAHVDDSTSYQVYNNILEQESTTTSAKETYGQLMYVGETNELAGTYYYSTSCGLGSDATVWKTSSGEELTYLKAKAINRTAMEQTYSDTDIELMGQAAIEEDVFAEFIQSKNKDDFEAEEGWYRWTYTVPQIDIERMYNVLQKRYDSNNSQVLVLDNKGEYNSSPILEFDTVKDLYVEQRGPGGIAEELIIVTNKQTIKVITEHNIRYVLNDGVSKINRQDGSEIASPNILPSGFFILNMVKEDKEITGYSLTGGGFGHGVGMSQNGARSMAKAGYNSDEILGFFYEGCFLRNIYE